MPTTLETPNSLCRFYAPSDTFPLSALFPPWNPDPNGLGIYALYNTDKVSFRKIKLGIKIANGYIGRAVSFSRPFRIRRNSTAMVIFFLFSSIRYRIAFPNVSTGSITTRNLGEYIVKRAMCVYQLDNISPGSECGGKDLQIVFHLKA